MRGSRNHACKLHLILYLFICSMEGILSSLVHANFISHTKSCVFVNKDHVFGLELRDWLYGLYFDILCM